MVPLTASFPAHKAAKQPHPITLPPPWLTAYMFFHEILPLKPSKKVKLFSRHSTEHFPYRSGDHQDAKNPSSGIWQIVFILVNGGFLIGILPMDANTPHSLSYCWIINTVFNFKKEIKQRQNSFWQHWIWHYPDENQFMFYIRYNFAPIYMPDYSREKEEARAGYLCPDLFFSLEI